MARTTTVPLLDPRLDHDETRITEVVLREPTAGDYYQHGTPWTRVDRPDGSVIILENRDAIRDYLRACIDERARPHINSFSLSDAEALKEALLDFFAEARRRRTNSPASPAPSSSDTGSSTPSDSAA